MSVITSRGELDDLHTQGIPSQKVVWQEFNTLVAVSLNDEICRFSIICQSILVCITHNVCGDSYSARSSLSKELESRGIASHPKG